MSDRKRFGFSRPVWLLGWVSLATDTATEMIYPLLPLFLTRVLGASAMSLGVIEGVAEAANTVLKIISGRLADRTGRPRRLVLIGYGLSSAIRPLIALATTWTQVLAIRFADRMGKGIRGAPRDAMLAHFADAAERGRVYGFHRAMDHAGAVLGPALAALFLYFRPEDYRTLFALAIVPGAIVVTLILFVPESPRPPAADRAAGSPPMPAAALGTTLERALAVILLFGLGNASDAFLLLRLSDAGIAAFWIPLLWSGLHIVKAATSLVGGSLSDRLGRRRLIGAGWLLYAAVYGAFAVVGAPWALVIVFLTYGLYFGLTEGVERAWIADLAPLAARGTAFGYYNAVTGISALLASLGFGLIWTRVSPEAAFLTGASLAMAATLLLYLLFSDEADPGHQ